MARNTHDHLAELIYQVRDKLTPEQAGGTGGSEGLGTKVLDVVYLVGCYHFARWWHAPEEEKTDDELTATGSLSGPRSELRDADATPEAVLAALRAHTHAHLACHGVRDPADPSQSRLLLHGDDLAPRQLAAERLRGAEFAYLSACHSAAPGKELADEVISVASAFQLCGYRHVIGSLWTVEDDMGPLLAQEVYRLLGAPDTPGTAHALHRAIGKLRQHDRYREPLFWASVVHSGP
ncbi:CHAT domain-containing protein [Streptomyces ficellus]|uniref:CHAT domain-containing protein n=1 Tax=Streptomyces ficellus TaxID=1977088 RepID=A0ABT7Z4D4_9ACTN|nr:CHAT domain-containing protein [Streptomyces ficellus]MDN3294358.1 CHAT domain-containing protein [Streptomyces ficellus]